MYNYVPGNSVSYMEHIQIIIYMQQFPYGNLTIHLSYKIMRSWLRQYFADADSLKKQGLGIL